MVYHFKVHAQDNGYWAECLELEGCATEGDTMEELRQNAEEALNLYLEEPEDSTAVPAPPQRHAGEEIINVPVDPELALSVLLRGLRAEHHYTQRDVAEKLGMKNLFSYQRLERRSNPNLKTLRKLKKVFPDLSVDYVLKD
jgi:predicted RNase H-like HicB family nuclease/DNA-binding XRE family transcriptional regulator